MDRYKYQRSGLPSEPMRYNYSEYGGEAFFDSYFKARERAVNSLSTYLTQRVNDGIKDMDSNERTELKVLSHIIAPQFYDSLGEERGIDTANADNWTGEVLAKAGRLPAFYRLYILGLTKGFPGLEGPLHTVSILKDNGLRTEDTLKLIILERTRLLPLKLVETDEIIDRLTKKYEVFQRLFSSYDSSFRKASKDFTNPINYALLGVISADIFAKERNYRDLNTLLKINDLLASVTPTQAGLTGAMLIRASLEREVHLIRGLRER